MRLRRLGRTNLEISPIVYGAMGFGSASEESRLNALAAAIDSGLNAIDTAPLYEFGGSEKLLGRFLKGGVRDRVVVMSKVGLRWDDPHGDVLFESPRGVVRKNSRPDSLRWEVDQSLARLGIDHLDLVQIHHPDVHTPIAESIGALLELRRAGKVREIGVSNFWPALLADVLRALGDVPLASIQQELNLIERSAERELLPWARAHQVGVLVYSPLHKGVLSGRVALDRVLARDDFRSELAAFQPANRAAINGAIDRVVRPIASRHGVSVAQVVLAWVLAQSGVTAAIAGASSAEQARENALASAVALTGIEILEIRAAFEALSIAATVRGGLRARVRHRLRSIWR